MKLVISNIDWETDGADAGLPSQVVVDDPMLLPHLTEDMNDEAANIAEWLAQEYGYLVNGFTSELEGVEGI